MLQIILLNKKICILQIAINLSLNIYFSKLLKKLRYKEYKKIFTQSIFCKKKKVMQKEMFFYSILKYFVQ